MAYEMLVGLDVTDNNDYQLYREAMTPMLESIGGSFGYDFMISDVLKSENEKNINRLFTLRFPSEEIMKEFFSNPEYLEANKKYFKPSVKSTTLIATYER